jgi:hypothetical protein
MEEWQERKCDVCGRDFTENSWDDKHDFHEPDCPNFRDRTKKRIRQLIALCDCDLLAHDECCPECHPSIEHEDFIPNTLAEELRRLN